MQKCDRCKSLVPSMDTFKAVGMTVCQSCYRLFTHGNTRYVESEASSVVDVDKLLDSAKPHCYVRGPSENKWY